MKKPTKRRPLSARREESATNNFFNPSDSTFFSPHNSTPIQTKLEIGQPGDQYEQEADRVADQVVQMQGQQHSKEENEEEPINVSQALQKPIQRQESSKIDDELQMKSQLQRQPDGSEIASDELASSISSARGQGHSLANEIRDPMEQAFGLDLSGVRVHTDSRSDQLNKTLQARAFTTGQDIFFRQGEYGPASLGGQKLLAHELTHVVQQSGGLDRSVATNGLAMNTVQCKASHVPDIQRDAGLTVSIIGLIFGAGTWAVGQNGRHPMTINPSINRIAEMNKDRETYRTNHPFQTKSWTFFDKTLSSIALDSRWMVDLRWQYNGAEITDVHLAQGWEDFFPTDDTHAKVIMTDTEASNKRIGFRCEFDWDPASFGHYFYQCDGWISADGSARHGGWRRQDR